MPGLLGGAGEAASAATEMGAAYIRRHGTRYAVGSEKPGTPTLCGRRARGPHKPGIRADNAAGRTGQNPLTRPDARRAARHPMPPWRRPFWPALSPPPRLPADPQPGCGVWRTSWASQNPWCSRDMRTPGRGVRWGALGIGEAGIIHQARTAVHAVPVGSSRAAHRVWFSAAPYKAASQLSCIKG